MALLTKKELPFRNDKDLAGLVTSWAAVTRVRQRMARNNNRIINGWRWAPGQKSPTCGLHRIYRSPLSSCTNLRPMGLRRWAEPAFLFVIDNGALPPPPPHSADRPLTTFSPLFRQKILALGLPSSFELYQAVPFCSSPFFFFFFRYSIFENVGLYVYSNRSKARIEHECYCEEKFLFDVFLFFFLQIQSNGESNIAEWKRGEARIRFVSFRSVSCLFENPYFLCTYTNYAYSNGSLNLAWVKMQSTTHDLERRGWRVGREREKKYRRNRAKHEDFQRRRKKRCWCWNKKILSSFSSRITSALLG